MRSLRSTSNGCCLSFFSTFERARKKGSTGRTRTASSRSGTPHTHCRRSPSPSPSRAPKQRRSRCRPMQHRLARARPPWRRAATGGRARPRITSDEALARASSGGTGGAAVEEPATTLRVSRLSVCSCHRAFSPSHHLVENPPRPEMTRRICAGSERSTAYPQLQRERTLLAISPESLHVRTHSDLRCAISENSVSKFLSKTARQRAQRESERD